MSEPMCPCKCGKTQAEVDAIIAAEKATAPPAPPDLGGAMTTEWKRVIVNKYRQRLFNEAYDIFSNGDEGFNLFKGETILADMLAEVECKCRGDFVKDLLSMWDRMASIHPELARERDIAVEWLTKTWPVSIPEGEKGGE